MQAVLGEPPAEFLARSERSLQFWNEKGMCSFYLPSGVNNVVNAHVAGVILTIDIDIDRTMERRGSSSE